MNQEFHNRRKAIALCTQLTKDAGLPSYGELVALLRRSHALLDSVAFVSTEGDTDKIVSDIKAAMGG